MNKLINKFNHNFYLSNTETCSYLDNKQENELKSAKQLYGLLPEKTHNKMWALFEEYENQSSEEARLVKRIDKLMPLIQNLCTNETWSSYRALGVDKQEAHTYLKQFFPMDCKEQDLFKLLFSKADESGIFATNPNNPQNVKNNEC